MTGSDPRRNDTQQSTAAPAASASAWPARDLIAIRAESTPDRLALVDAPTGDRWTYRELDALVERYARGLRALEPSSDSPPDRVAALSEPTPGFVALLHATWRVGTELVPLGARDPASTLAWQIEHTDATALLVAGSLRETARDVEDRLDPDLDCHVESLDQVRNDQDVDSLESVRNDQDADDEMDSTGDGRQSTTTGLGGARITPDDVRLLPFTSGSTGEPKAVRVTGRNLLASATASAFRLGVHRGDRWLSPLPVSHMGGLAPPIRCALYGATLLLQQGFDAERTATALEEHDATGVSLVPTALSRLLDAGWEPGPSLRFVLLGGAAADQSLLERCEERAVPVHPTYGMTETASQIATATPDQAFAEPGTVGQPLVNTTVRVLDGDGDPVEAGERGELVVDGPTVTPGYLGAERDGAAAGAEATRNRFSGMGFHTGDEGYRDADGFVFVNGRLDETIVTGGENVSPATVVAVLESVDGVQAAAVTGLPDEEWGERVVALVEPTTGSTVDDAAIRAAVEDRLAPAEVPKTIVGTDAIPRTASGTVDRDAVRAVVREAEGESSRE